VNIVLDFDNMINQFMLYRAVFSGKLNKTSNKRKKAMKN